jgi:hypothetical protein
MGRRIAFNRGVNPESGARTRTHSESPAATGQKVSLLTPQRFNQSRGACRILGENKSKNEIDTLPRILVETVLHF